MIPQGDAGTPTEFTMLLSALEIADSIQAAVGIPNGFCGEEKNVSDRDQNNNQTRITERFSEHIFHSFQDIP